MRRRAAPAGRTRRRGRAPGIPGRASGPDAAARERIHRAFLAMALAHELKQPLNSLNLNAELLAKRLGRQAGAAAADVAGPLQALGRVVDRVTACLEAFTLRVQPDPVPEAPAELRPILSAALARCRDVAGRAGVRLSLAIDAGLPRLPVHADQLAVALEALLDNAVAASPRGSEVRLQARPDGDEVRIDVVDHGAGMSPEVMRRAVEIGYSTRGGDGTGLTVAKFIAYHHCGGFHLDSRPGGGTTATMVLPVGGV